MHFSFFFVLKSFLKEKKIVSTLGYVLHIDIQQQKTCLYDDDILVHTVCIKTYIYTRYYFF